ncbi:MAG: N-acetyltransferase [Bacillota bacterium]
MEIRESTEADFKGLLAVGRQAFGDEEGPEIVELVQWLMVDTTAEPRLSMVAVKGRRIVGHILFTRAKIKANEQIKTACLAPLAVAVDYQNRGIGRRLVEEGLRLLKERGVELVFVLGHPTYYPRCGFKPAGPFGFATPYPIAEKDADAWMVCELQPGLLGVVKGRVLFADTLHNPKYWSN